LDASSSKQREPRESPTASASRSTAITPSDEIGPKRTKRFWAKVRKTDGCWEWAGTYFVNGYGKYVIDGKQHKAHRVAWQITHGRSPGALLVCHTCDNPACVRPDHLFAGSHADNMLDMAKKGRRRGVTAGERNGRAKLTEQDVHAILRSSENNSSTGRRYGVSPTNIRDIRLGRLWKDVVARCETLTKS
jgi:hypothetical protein